MTTVNETFTEVCIDSAALARSCTRREFVLKTTARCAESS